MFQKKRATTYGVPSWSNKKDFFEERSESFIPKSYEVGKNKLPVVELFLSTSAEQEASDLLLKASSLYRDYLRDHPKAKNVEGKQFFRIFKQARSPNDRMKATVCRLKGVSLTL